MPGGEMMKNTLLGWMALVWGGLVLLGGLPKLVSAGAGAGAYGAGQLAKKPKA